MSTQVKVDMHVQSAGHSQNTSFYVLHSAFGWAGDVGNVLPMLFLRELKSGQGSKWCPDGATGCAAPPPATPTQDTRAWPVQPGQAAGASR